MSLRAAESAVEVFLRTFEMWRQTFIVVLCSWVTGMPASLVSCGVERPDCVGDLVICILAGSLLGKAGVVVVVFF